MKIYDLPSLYQADVNNIRALMETQAKKEPDYISYIFDKTSTDKYEDRDVEIGGVEGLELWEENKGAALTDYVEGFETTYKQLQFARKIPIGRFAQKFLMYNLGKVETAGMKLAKKGMRSIQERAFEVLSRGRDATFDHGRNDGVTVFSAVHPYSPEDATTYSNVVTDSEAPGYDGVMKAVELLVEMPDDVGDQMDLGSRGYTIITGNFQDYLKFQQVVDPEANLQPETMDNDINVFNGKVRGLDRPIKVVYVPYAQMTGYDNAFWVMANEGDGEKPFQMLEAEPFTTEEYDDPETKTKYIRASVMYDRKVKDPRKIVLSLGDGTTTVTT